MREIQRLHEMTIMDSQFEAQISNFIDSEEDFEAWTRRLYLLEQGIGGIGIHNVNRIVDERDRDPIVTGTYRIEDRPIFRPIQYCAALLLTWFVAVDTRYLVDNGCSYIEGILKRILQELRGMQKIEISMGPVINHLSGMQELKNADGSEILEVSRIINKIYRSAKHEFGYNHFESTDPQSSLRELGHHLFTYEEAAITYFGCRLHGLHLMEWMRGRGIEPRSVHDSYLGSWREFSAIASHLSSSLRFSEPDLLKRGQCYLEDIRKPGRPE